MTGTAPPAPAAAAAPARRRRRFRWTRRVVKALVVVVLLLAVLQYTIPFIAPSVLESLFEGMSLTARFDRMEVSFLGGEVEIWGLVVTPAEGGEPFATLDYVRGDLSVQDLLVGRLRVERAVVDGLTARVERDAEGRWEPLRRLAGDGSEPEPPPEEPAGAVSFSSPIVVDALRVERVRLHIADHLESPPFETTADLTVRVTDLGSAERKASIEVYFSSTGVLDALSLTGSSRLEEREFGADLALKILGIRPGPAERYLRGLGIVCAAKEYSVVTGITLAASVEGEDDDRIRATVALHDFSARADGSEAAGIDRVLASVPLAGAAGLTVSRAEVEGVRARAEIRPDGSVRIAGVDIPPRAGGPAAPSEAPEAPPAEEPAAAVPGTPGIRIEDALIRGIDARFVDGSNDPPADLRVRVEELAVKGFSPSAGGGPMQVAGRFTAPGAFEEFTLNGEVVLFGPEKKADLVLALRGLTAESIRPYLAGSGVEPDVRGGDLMLRLSALARYERGTVAGDLRIDEIGLTGPEGERLGVQGLTVADFRLDPATGDLSAARVALARFAGEARRSADGTLHLPGIVVRPVVEGPPTPPPPEPAPPPGPPPGPARVPRIEVGGVELAGISALFVDESGDRPLRYRLADSSLTVGAVLIDGGPPGPTALAVRLHAPGIAEDIEAAGTLHLHAEGGDADVTVDARGVTAAELEPFFETAGLERRLKSAALKVGVKARAQRRSDGFDADLTLSDLVLVDGEAELAALKSLRIAGCAVRAEGVLCESVTVVEPRLWAAREVDGGLLVLGVRVPPGLAPRRLRPSGEPAGPAPAPSAAPGAPMRVSVGALAVTGGRLLFEDAAEPRWAKTELVADAALDAFSLGGEDADSKFVVDVHELVRGLRVRAEGEVSLGGPESRVGVDLAVDGISAAALGPWLPPAVKTVLADGRFRARVEARSAAHPEGGARVSAEVRSLSLRDGEGGDALLEVDRISAEASRLDGGAGVYAFDHLRVEGVEADVAQDAAGGLAVPGFVLAPSPAAPAAPAAPPAPAAAPAAATAADLPLLTISELLVGVRRLGLATPALARPVEVRNLTVRELAPIAVLGDDPGAQGPVRIHIEGDAAPLAKRFAIDTGLLPFADQPEAQVGLRIEGLDGAALAEVLPALAGSMDPAGLTGVDLHAKAHALLKMRRKSALDFGLDRGFAAEAELTDLSLTRGHEVLLGIAAVTVRAQEIDLPGRLIHLKSVEIAEIKGEVKREADGLRVAGLLLPDPPETGAGGPVPPPTPEAPTAEARSGLEFRVDSLYVTDLDGRYQDLTATPPVDVPLRDLTLEVRGFTTRALTEEIPVLFRMAVASDKVTLPLTPPEESQAFGELSATGRLSLFPVVRGWVKGGLSALELSMFRGLAKSAGFELNDGVLDLGLDLRFQEDGSLELVSRSTLTDLDMSEPPDGPISKLLALPTPLNTVIFILKDESGAIRIPLSFTVPADGIGTGQTLTLATTTLGRLIVNAVAASPFRMVGTVTGGVGAVGGILGLGGEEEAAEAEPVAASFEPGDAFLSAAEKERLKDLLEELDDDDELVVSLRHELGPADLPPLARRANPPPESCQDLAARLRRRKFDILETRGVVAAEARAALAAGLSDQAAAATRQLQALDRDLAATERSIDAVLDLLRPGAERLADRRTREAAVALANLRIEEAARFLLLSGIDDIDKRIRVKRARYEDPKGEGGGRVLLTLRREVGTK